MSFTLNRLTLLATNLRVTKADNFNVSERKMSDEKYRVQATLMALAADPDDPRQQIAPFFLPLLLQQNRKILDTAQLITAAEQVYRWYLSEDFVQSFISLFENLGWLVAKGNIHGASAAQYLVTIPDVVNQEKTFNQHGFNNLISDFRRHIQEISPLSGKVFEDEEIIRILNFGLLQSDYYSKSIENIEESNESTTDFYGNRKEQSEESFYLHHL